ncbi:chaplin family protein [Streptomyces sp. NPDC014656]|uniref:chaplin family protein n=1 Tax=Streptomyces sp. NPDC014656 TaxID=3364878 RepID=UPI0036F6FF02
MYGGGAGARGMAAHAPGAGSGLGNSVRVPVRVPVDACGDAVGVIGPPNPSFGDTSVNF